MLTGAQIRAARALLNLSVAELSEITGLAINTIRRAEGTNEQAPTSAANLNLLIHTFDAAGIVFVAADEMGVGVRFASPDTPAVGRRRRDTRSG